MTDFTVRVAALHPSCTVLGPGTRFAIWVQGCPLSCRECISPQWIPAEGGHETPIGELADRVVREAADGLTISGGEPFAQAAALAALVEQVRARRDLSVLSYTGYTVEHLRRHGTPAQTRLLGLLDVVIDGPYLVDRHADLRWRGSANQRIHVLTDRHRGLGSGPEAGVGLQFEIDRSGALTWLGVPPVRGFRGRLEEALGVAGP
ncbi:4Fe-4S single cluster domain-containing protein [Actinoplanes sp. CA-142083]|uniref:4Fe-4S single cluster domain-containing protein n=1 Tax=Actinoplanes sp. CA-142083 TaxID=3239903 RepID=UPI003D8CC36C